AASISGELKAEVDKAADAKPWSLMVVAMLAVGREGLETALFVWAATQATTRGTGGNAIPLLGALLGIATAIVLGYLFYSGAVRINLTRFFTWTGGFLIIVAAGVLAYGVHDLQEAGILPGLNNLAFDVSRAIPPTSWYGTLLKGIFNFSPATTWLEAIVWIAYVVPTMALFLRRIRRRSRSTSAASSAVPASGTR
ncbi:MAG TPA: FTR1 family protein, partial [Microlunatus sp.]|nr:FTR1 family protein [Microlunatus sp.]